MPKNAGNTVASMVMKVNEKKRRNHQRYRIIRIKLRRKHQLPNQKLSCWQKSACEPIWIIVTEDVRTSINTLTDLTEALKKSNKHLADQCTELQSEIMTLKSLAKSQEIEKHGAFEGKHARSLYIPLPACHDERRSNHSRSCRFKAPLYVPQPQPPSYYTERPVYVHQNIGPHTGPRRGFRGGYRSQSYNAVRRTPWRIL